MSYRRERFGHDLSYLVDSFHLVASKMGVLKATNDEKNIREYAAWKQKVNEDLPFEGYANPHSFRQLLEARIERLQTELAVDDTVFVSNETPFDRSKNPHGTTLSIHFPTLTLDLLKNHPDHNFPHSQDQGIEWRGDNLYFKIIDSKHQQRTITVENNIIKPTHPRELKFLIAASAWALDPERL